MSEPELLPSTLDPEICSPAALSLPDHGKAKALGVSPDASLSLTHLLRSRRRLGLCFPDESRYGLSTARTAAQCDQLLSLIQIITKVWEEDEGEVCWVQHTPSQGH